MKEIMSIECTEVEYCKLQVQYVGDAEVVSEKRNEAVKQLRSLPVPGFRPGKATSAAIKAKYSSKIDEYVKREMLTQAYDDILFETKMRPIGAPQTLDLQLKDNSFSCTLMFLKKPEFELQNVKGLEIPKPHGAGTVTDFAEQILEQVRRAHGDIRPYDDNDFVQNGDKVTLDYSVSQDGEIVNTVEGTLYTVGSNALPDFDNNILGMSPGDDREYQVTLNDKVSVVKIHVHMGLRTIPAALDDELAKKLGFEDYNALRTNVEGIASAKLSEQERNLITDQVKKQLVSMHDFQPPPWLVQMEAQRMSLINKVNWSTASEEMRAEFHSQATKNVKFSLILDSIRQAEPEADLSDQEVYGIIQSSLAQQGKEAGPTIQQWQKEGRISGIVGNIRNQHTLDFVVKNAKVIE